MQAGTILGSVPSSVNANQRHRRCGSPASKVPLQERPRRFRVELQTCSPALGNSLKAVAVEIVTYPHFTLRYKSQPVTRVDRDLRNIASQMFDLMYEANGVGLAANQVNLPFRLFVMNMAAAPDEGEELVFINPVISHPKGTEKAEEGCLSLPGVYGTVARAKQIHLQAFNLQGQEFKADVDGMFARVVQHETDHLDGVLFTDRMTTTGKLAIQESLEEFELEKQNLRNLDQLDSDEQIQDQLQEWETRYCRKPG